MTQLFDWTVQGKLRFVLEPQTADFHLSSWDNGHAVRVSLVTGNVVAYLPSVKVSIGFRARFIVCATDPAHAYTLTINNGTDPVSMFQDGTSNTVASTRCILSSNDGVGQYIDVFSDGVRWSIHSSNSIKNNAALVIPIVGNTLDLNTATSFTSLDGRVVQQVPSGSIFTTVSTSAHTLRLGSQDKDKGKTFSILFAHACSISVRKSTTDTDGVLFNGLANTTWFNIPRNNIGTYTGKVGDMLTFTNVYDSIVNQGLWSGTGAISDTITTA